jgi:hypothetical protein
MFNAMPGARQSIAGAPLRGLRSCSLASGAERRWLARCALKTYGHFYDCVILIHNHRNLFFSLKGINPMNKELPEILSLYSTGTHQALSSYLVGKSKDTLIAILLDLLTMYINDKNSSTIREYLTVTLSGYTHKEKKIGYNGFKQDSFSGKTTNCEAKPKNVDTNSSSPSKLKGYGNFSDYTFARLAKDLKEDSLNMLVSGFVDGRLIYIIEFPFSCPSFADNLKKQLMKRFPGGKDISTEYLRSASFDHRQFKDCDDLRIIFIAGKDELVKYKQYIVKDFYSFLEANTK